MNFLDSHIVIWLYLKELDLLPQRVLSILENETSTILPIVILELEYLLEIGKITEHGEPIVDYLSLRLGLKINNFVFTRSFTPRWTNGGPVIPLTGLLPPTLDAAMPFS